MSERADVKKLLHPNYNKAANDDGWLQSDYSTQGRQKKNLAMTQTTDKLWETVAVHAAPMTADSHMN